MQIKEHIPSEKWGEVFFEFASPCESLSRLNKRDPDFGVTGYPSMVESDYTVQFNRLQGELNVTLFDLQGRKLYAGSFHEVKAVTLSFDHLAQGCYVLVLDNGFHTESLRFVKTVN